MTTDKKMSYMVENGKTTRTTQQIYDELNKAHEDAKMRRETEKVLLNQARENLKMQRRNFRSISLFHPVLKIKAFKAVGEAKKQCDERLKALHDVRLPLRESQKQLREIRSVIREQYIAVKQNDIMNSIISTMQSNEKTQLSEELSEEFKKQRELYDSQVFHIDEQNPENNTKISRPRKDLYGLSMKFLAKHVSREVIEKSPELLKNLLKYSVGKRLGKMIEKTSAGVKILNEVLPRPKKEEQLGLEI